MSVVLMRVALVVTSVDHSKTLTKTYVLSGRMTFLRPLSDWDIWTFVVELCSPQILCGVFCHVIVIEKSAWLFSCSVSCLFRKITPRFSRLSRCYYRRSARFPSRKLMLPRDSAKERGVLLPHPLCHRRAQWPFGDCWCRVLSRL